MTTNDTVEDGASPGLRKHHIDAFLAHLRHAGYSEVTLGKKRRVLNAFSRWMRSKSIVLEHLDESDLAEFAKNPQGARASYVQFKFLYCGSTLPICVSRLWCERRRQMPS